MNLTEIIILSLIQGISEFLPIGVSGHMALVKELLRLPSIPNLANLLLELGLLIAVVLMHLRPLGHMLRHPLSSRLKWLLVSVLPPIAAVLFLPQGIIDMLSTKMNIGIFMLLTCVILLTGEAGRLMHDQKHKRISFFDALSMGMLRAAAELPGTSSLGFAITGGLCTGLSRRRAVEFSYLMFVPMLLFRIGMNIYSICAQAGASGMTLMNELHNDLEQMGGLLPAGLCTLLAALSGCLSIALCRLLIKKFGMKVFAFYTGAFGLVLIAWQLMVG